MILRLQGEKMLDEKYQRGFSNDKLASTVEPRVKRDDSGYYIQTISENVKVYFDDYYKFLEQVHIRCLQEMQEIDQRLEATDEDNAETLAYYRARLIIVNIVRNTALSFYMDSSNFGVVMTPWCFGTVALEKVEVYRDRMSRGDVQDPNVPDFPYYVIRYIDEISRATLLSLFEFPEQAFQMRWQYSELLRRYSKALSSINDSLENVLTRIKNYQP
jgi:hypothetical protein